MPGAVEKHPETAGRDATPFAPGHRTSGLLLHLTSLPSSYGIGDLGPGAFQWVDRLHDAGQTWWQCLPLGPTGHHNSPYQSLTSFIGNTLMVSPDLLVEDGLLTPEDCHGAFSATAIDFDAVIPFKNRLLETAWKNFGSGTRRDLAPAYEEFRHSRGEWLEEYALFRALRSRFNNAWFLEWPEELVRRLPSALERARRELAPRIDQVRFGQFLLARQGDRLKAYARERGVRLIGDLPFFVSADSSDVWANPELFLLDERRRPRFVAGVPPDCFSAEGQLWGNPVYDWGAHRRSGFSWWTDRIRALAEHVDLIRLDHFRAFAAAWHVRAGAQNAVSGEWVPGPGVEFFRTLKAELGALPFIAEDLGHITADVCDLRDEFEIPSTRVLQFAFGEDPENEHLPEQYGTRTVAYTGTHDNPTSREWFESLSPRERNRFWRYLKRPEGEIRDAAPELIRLAWQSPAALAITPLQDLLNLGGEGRMNVPGRAEGNWRWRATQHMLGAREFEWLADLTRKTNRSGCAGTPTVRCGEDATS